MPVYDTTTRCLCTQFRPRNRLKQPHGTENRLLPALKRVFSVAAHERLSRSHPDESPKQQEGRQAQTQAPIARFEAMYHGQDRVLIVQIGSKDSQSDQDQKVVLITVKLIYLDRNVLRTLKNRTKESVSNLVHRKTFLADTCPLGH